MLHIKCLYECVWVVFVCHWFCLVCTLSFFKCTGSTTAYKFKVTYLGGFFLSVWHCAHCVCRWWLKLKWFTCSAFRRKKKKHRSRICPFQEPPLNTWTSRQVCAIVSWVFIQEAAQTHYSRWGRERERCVINADFNFNLFIHCQITTIVTTRHCSPLLHSERGLNQSKNKWQYGLDVLTHCKLCETKKHKKVMSVFTKNQQNSKWINKMSSTYGGFSCRNCSVHVMEFTALTVCEI